MRTAKINKLIEKTLDHYHTHDFSDYVNLAPTK